MCATVPHILRARYTLAWGAARLSAQPDAPLAGACKALGLDTE